LGFINGFFGGSFDLPTLANCNRHLVELED
jgi:hypothetical protein